MATLRIGVTGNIGSGKTTVCKIFECLDIPIYYADDRAKSLMQNDATLKSQIRYLLGPESYDNGLLNRRYISNIVFKNKAKLEKLNALVHPAVQRDSDIWFSKQTTPYAITEAALLVESGSYKFLDKLIVVTANEETRIQRVMSRDQTNRSSVVRRMNNQLSEKEKIAASDMVIHNDNKDVLIKQIWHIHRNIVDNL